jgi:hypothetical protein
MLLSVDVYLAREDHFERMNELYILHFGEPRPACTTITAGLRPNVRFEISVLAVLETSTQPGIPGGAAQDPVGQTAASPSLPRLPASQQHLAKIICRPQWSRWGLLVNAQG